MKRVLMMIGVLAAIASAGFAQSPSSSARHVVGHQISGHSNFDARTQTTTVTATLTFTGNDGAPVVTIDFITRYPGAGRPLSAPRVVDVVVTEHAADEERPEMSVRIDGASVPLAARLYSRRSIATTISFDEFVRLVNADAIVEQALGNELEFGNGQLQMLRAEAQRWSGR
jgi:hypothetical protein